MNDILGLALKRSELSVSLKRGSVWFEIPLLLSIVSFCHTDVLTFCHTDVFNLCRGERSTGEPKELVELSFRPIYKVDVC